LRISSVAALITIRGLLTVKYLIPLNPMNGDGFKSGTTHLPEAVPTDHPPTQYKETLML
jgi:hypothetical protein